MAPTIRPKARMALRIPVPAAAVEEEVVPLPIIRRAATAAAALSSSVADIRKKVL